MCRHGKRLHDLRIPMNTEQDLIADLHAIESQLAESACRAYRPSRGRAKRESPHAARSWPRPRCGADPVFHSGYLVASPLSRLAEALWPGRVPLPRPAKIDDYGAASANACSTRCWIPCSRPCQINCTDISRQLRSPVLSTALSPGPYTVQVAASTRAQPGTIMSGVRRKQR